MDGLDGVASLDIGQRQDCSVDQVDWGWRPLVCSPPYSSQLDESFDSRNKKLVGLPSIKPGAKSRSLARLKRLTREKGNFPGRRETGKKQD